MLPPELNVEGGYAIMGALQLPELSTSAPISTVYAAKGERASNGMSALLSLMASNGLSLHGTTDNEGLIGRADLVLVKVNGEWEERGGTNTDLLKAFIQAVLNHPDGFEGEIVVVENGQWAIHLDSTRSNAEDRRQSFRRVVNDFQSQGYRVSLYDWTSIGGTAGEVVIITEDEMTKDGYVDMPGGVSYPIFTTKFGTRVNLKDGIWDGAKYDGSRMRFINMPVLKSHSLMGVTGATKHYMGVLSTSLCNDGFSQHPGMIEEGLMGRVMAKVIYPDLNIMDAQYVGVSPEGPASSYQSAYQADLILASRDPIALDYYAGKYILLPLTGSERHDPECLNTANSSGFGGYPVNAFRQYLASSKRELEDAGYEPTMTEDEIRALVSSS